LTQKEQNAILSLSVNNKTGKAQKSGVPATGQGIPQDTAIFVAEGEARWQTSF
jgi:hypothetical protein